MMKKLKLLCVVALCNLTFGAPSLAQSGNVFSSAAVVNDAVVTNFELFQRVSMLQVFGARADLRNLAMGQLVDERLYLQAGEQMGVTVSEGEVLDGMNEFAARADLTSDQLIEILGQRGVVRETFYDFVHAGLVWRTVVRTRFARQAQITENDVDVALLRSPGQGGRQPNEILGYATLALPASEGDVKTRAAKARVLRTEIDTCLDLRAARNNFEGSEFGEGGGRLADIPDALRGPLNALDPRETTTITGADGRTTVLMLCSRSRELPEGDRSNITEILVNQKIAGLANGYLQELKGDAFIDIK
ncbi:hypothetical protein GCM10007939_04100 [Amylibacter marinus]|uniref:SurA N-terminal domain-containing protein n=1 Tax=Amylibacter marinus TaxID=1475483 RepID=A0ABQ5VSK6_9RHOB|nr:SurA N-terminal domain-containing protein [Amylibacter marinus]GLQ34127.1 hypothetical protein GCM10007939_04100 [Amylibacter marinus]